MAVTVVGSVAFDSLETPFGARERILGGAATHFSVSASFFTDVRVVGVVGDDFGEDELAVFRGRGVNTDDVERIEGGKSFFWKGRYEDDMSVAHTLDTQLNVFGEFEPKLSDESKQSQTLFLANIHPEIQRTVLEQSSAAFTGLDSMNFWIESEREALVRTMSRVRTITLNDAEIRQLTQEPNLLKAARKVMDLGPEVVLMKQGPFGACMYTERTFFSVPAYPLETVIDPTGAGDTFAGGFFGYLDSLGRSEFDDADLRTAMVAGSVMASFIVEDFGNERLQRLGDDEILARFEGFKQMTQFEVPDTLPRLLSR